MFVSLGPLAAKKVGAKGVGYSPAEAGIYQWIREQNGEARPGSEYVKARCAEVGGCPSIYFDYQVAEAILALSPEANGKAAVETFKALAKRTGEERVVELGLHNEGKHIRFRDIIEQPRRSLTSPVWAGIEAEGRTYSPFTINTEYMVPWRTLTGRQHFYIDHEWFRELGEYLPNYKPPLDWAALGLLVDVDVREFDYDPAKYRIEKDGKRMMLARFLTPHGKWNIHSTYWDNLYMLTLFRGGQVVWMNDEDARWLGLRDNDWIELYNANGVIVARVATSPRIPRGTVIMYHAQERHVYVPISERSGKRGGIHNSVTAAHLKPTKMVGGYAQLSYFINYYGPTGVNRDTVVLIRKRETPPKF